MSTSVAAAGPATQHNRLPLGQPSGKPSDRNLWGKLPIEVIGGTGEFGMGKSLFGLTIDPQNTIVYDNEGSTTIYQGLGFERVDMALELMRLHPNGYKPIDRFRWWRADVRQRIQPGRYSVIMVDPVSEIESGLADYVMQNAHEFGYSQNQFAKSGGLYWGCVKDVWKTILDDLRVRCQTFYFVTHMRDEYRGNTPTGRREAKGKETLFELASLYLKFERTPDGKGNVPDVPAATVLKSRLAHASIVNGKPEVVPILPPRLPIATPDAIREYISHPADYHKLKAEERLREERMSDDERLRLQAYAAEQQATAKTAELSLVEKMQRAYGNSSVGASMPSGNGGTLPPEKPIASDQSAERAAAQQQRAAATAEQVKAESQAGPAAESATVPERINAPQAAYIREKFKLAFNSPAEFAAMLVQHGCDPQSPKLDQLSFENAGKVIAAINERIAAKQSAAAAQPAPANEPPSSEPAAEEKPKRGRKKKTDESTAPTAASSTEQTASEPGTGEPATGEPSAASQDPPESSQYAMLAEHSRRFGAEREAMLAENGGKATEAQRKRLLEAYIHAYGKEGAPAALKPFLETYGVAAAKDMTVDQINTAIESGLRALFAVSQHTAPKN